ncbi:MAG: hypothetical protein FGM54_09610 [Chitinophagaceae bacterium]|nr:hypothetical protein [Chitinophagaceae bacterium]
MHKKLTLYTMLFGLLLSWALIGCTNSKTNRQEWGWVPVYATQADLKNVYAQTAQATIKAGKIYRYNQWIFQVDLGTGIHVIDATQRNAPVKTAFIRVPGCSEISIRSNQLYTNNYRDLVAIDITQPLQANVVSRIENIFPAVSQDYPPQAGTWFECPDPSKGIIIAWTEQSIQNPKCKRP